jgi:hypothetical protein
MEFTETALLASIDHTLASIRAALYAAADPEQLHEAQAQLAEKAGEDTGRLIAHADAGEWPGVDPSVFDAIRSADDAGREGDLREIERRLAAAREMLGGPSA